MAPELRKDPTSGTWVVVASSRSRRPSDFKITHGEQKKGVCPFCYGNEYMTPPEVFASGRTVDAPNAEGWEVRVVPNKFPALIPDHEDSINLGNRHDKLYTGIPAVGIHEVLVESPEHDSTLGSHCKSRIEDVLTAIVARFDAVKKDNRIKYLQVFKNWGLAGGASLSHTHCQLIAVPIVPKTVQNKLDYAKQYKDTTGRCLYCDILRREIETKVRIVRESRSFLAFCPYASKFPYETWFIPKNHKAAFEDISKDEIVDLAGILRNVIRTFESAFDDVPYNMVWHTSPLKGDFNQYYHWHIELLPRLTTIAGFEFGTGFYINPTIPEAAAASLRGDPEA